LGKETRNWLTDTDNSLLDTSVYDLEATPAVTDFQAEQTALVYTQAPVALGTALAVAVLMTAGLWGVVDHGLLMLWLGLQFVQTLFRAGVVWFYRRASDAGRRDSRWAQLYFVGTLVSGIAWGCIGLFISPDMPVVYQVLVVMGFAGVLAGAISSYAALMPVYIAFMLPAMLITAQSMLLQAGQAQNVMGLLFILFAGALLVIARNYSGSVARILALRTENLGLLERMSESNSALAAEVRERKQIEDELRRDRQLFTRGPVTVFRWSTGPGWPIEYVSKTVAQFGYDADELVDNRTSFASLIYKTDLQHVEEAEFDSNDNGLVALGIDYRLVNAAGEVRWVYDYTIPVRDEHGKVTHYAGYLLDITDRKQAEFELSREKDRAQTTLNSIGELVITTDVNGQIEYMNPAAEQMTGWESDIARGLPLARVFSLFDDASKLGIETPVAQALRTGRAVKSDKDCMLQKHDATRYSVQYSISPLLNRNDDALGVVIVMHDVTEKRSMARQLSYQATHDVLTGLLNRREFEVRLAHAVETAKTEDEQHAICHLDIDQFKIINDACCHEAGDNLLRSIAGLLPGYLRDSDVLARLGSDEFGLLLKNCSLRDAADIAGHILSAIHAHRFESDGSIFDITASIGIALIDGQSQNITSVMGAADLACYVAKDLGRNRIHVYESGDQELMRRHSEMRWVSRITEAIDKNRFVLFCQDIRPVVPGADDEQHFEILVRMLDDDGEIVMPDKFLPSAERYNLVGPLDRWVIRNSFEWYAENCSGCCAGGAVVMAINLSGGSVADDSLLDYIKRELDRTGVPAAAVCFEITETAAIANLQAARLFIEDLHRLGCRFALDDFGSGLSSFTYLKTLPVDYLKIDGSFVRDMVADPVDFAMVSSMHQLGRAMGIKTVAEFVENDKVLEKLAEIGIDYAQGYGIGRPQKLHSKQVCRQKTA
jgi:diguanylate cyclase (GGDEF)-like protein/PAS domain S-box-containing protein